MDRDSPQQALLRWLASNWKRNFWVESMQSGKINCTMKQSSVFVGDTKIAKASVQFSVDDLGNVPDGVILDLIIKVLNQWQKKHGSLA